MQAFVSSVLGLSLMLAPPPPGERQAPASAPSADVEATISKAEDAWRRGDYPEVRRLLEPLENANIDDVLERQRVLTYLADATANDSALPQVKRRELASRLLLRIMDEDPSWEMPEGVYTPELYTLYVDVRTARTREVGAECRANLTACQADLRVAQAEIEKEQERYRDLERRFAEQEVEVRDRVARNRALALIPLGVGHFYNAAGTENPARRTNLALGGTFLAAELAFGIAGIGLLIQRTVVDGCRRTRGFQRGSLVCDEDRRVVEDGIEARRKAEEGVAWGLLVTVVVDIVLAQVRFKPYETTRIQRVPRRVLESRQQQADPPRRQQRKKTRANVRPTPAYVPGGGGLGLDIRF